MSTWYIYEILEGLAIFVFTAITLFGFSLLIKLSYDDYKRWNFIDSIKC